MKLKKKDKKPSNTLPFKEFFKFYTKVKVPWLAVILVAVLSFALKKVEVLLVPYNTRIMTGAIDEAGFLGGFIAMTLIYALMETLNEVMLDFSGNLMARNVRHKVWDKLLRLPMSFFDKDDNQELVSRITQDTTGALGAINVLIEMASILYGLYTAFSQMYITYKNLSLIMLSVFPLSIFASWLMGKMEFKIVEIVNGSYARLTNFYGERLPNILHIKTSNMENEEYQKGIKANDDRYKAEIKKQSIFIFQTPVGMFSQYINQVVLLLVATSLVRQGQMKMFQVVNLYNYFNLFMSNAFMLIASWQVIKHSHSSLTVIGRIINTDEENVTDGEHMKEENESIRFENFSFSYDGEKNVLDNVSFKIPKGKITAIVGENGSGKSTIIKLLERFNEANSGTIRVGDNKLCNINLSEWRESVGYIFQGNQIIKGSIEENIAYGINREYTREELIEATKLAKAYDFIMDKEQGFDTQISSFDTKLSGGEMQRLAIARIILKQPKYLIMDEATSGIDVVSEREVMEGLSSLMQGKTVIMVSHDMNMIKKADNIVVLGQGVIEANGSFDEVAEKSELFKQFLAVQNAC